MTEPAPDFHTWLIGCITDDEDVARAAIADDGGADGGFANQYDALVGTYGRPLDFTPRFAEAAAVLITRFAVPARVLADCAAKRAIIDEAYEIAAKIDSEWGCNHDAASIRRGGRLPEFDGDVFEPLPDDCCGPRVAAGFLTPLAVPYADRPGYQEEWRPTT